MNYSSTLSLNDNIQYKKPLKYRNRARSLMQKNNKSISSYNNKSIHNNGTSVMHKIKRMFARKSNNSVENVPNTKLKTSENEHDQIKDYRNINEFPLNVNQNIEWQPVYHETCKIKLPVEDSSTKVSLPQNLVDDWVHDQKNISNELNKSRIKNKEDDEKTNSQDNCFYSKNMAQNSCTSNNEEPYSKFKYYYNYYLVDEYLESLIESQNKKLDATGLDEEGQLYDNVSLNVKPIIMSKQRLENGVPYDPSKIMN
ncbi:conserved Plasmodium protein, unknown function [Plasmodium gallinaceum]|uniref:Uncharacterized protein n=1 Tax=Plasmodium gallinaceum TaxID=5849 RepID=A0A1J1GMZ7_PLAGA|nr:conserved Plasmodium protein, unknown function [Plasmodium gallinaceum]CRG93637.1 conserved Plasmodium protein, unknown function [Plasmodium gallinaceum]